MNATMHPHKNMTSSLILLMIFSSLSLCSSFLVDPNILEFSYLLHNHVVEQIEISAKITGDQVVGNNVTVIAQLNKEFNQTIVVELVCKAEKCMKILGGQRFGAQLFEPETKQLEWHLLLKDNGLATLLIEPMNMEDFDDTVEISNAQSSQQLKVGKSYALNTWAYIVGYIYFIAWMASLYPLLFTNFNRKSVVGLNLDFVALNTTGYLSYSIYNICLFYIYDFQEAYFQKFPGGEIPVKFNDVLFACHGFVINVLICVQCIFYERGNQVITKTAKSLLIAIYSPAVILTFFYIIDGVNKYYYVSFFSYCKLLLTLFKYIPQAYFNYQRKSTSGFSIAYIFLDLTGGSLSILQMLLDSMNQDDYRNFTGNAGKLGLGLVSIAFDFLFMTQHYCLYRHNDDPILGSERSNYGSNNSKNVSLSIEDSSKIGRRSKDMPISNNMQTSSNSGFQNQAFSDEI